MKKAVYFKPLPNNYVECILCPNLCRIADGKHGICLTRENKSGILFSNNYCRPVSLHTDPIEKKPLYHFLPGADIFSTGPNGCTFKCSFCQNSEISQSIVSAKKLHLEDFTERIINSGTVGVAYTYSEPYIWFETIMDVGTIIKEKGLSNVMVTNGYMNPEPLKELLSVVDAMNIDIKSINPEFYKKLCKGRLEPVLRTCETVKKHCHLEITNLLITGENDSEEDIRGLVDFIVLNLGKDTPLHISRYFPRYKLGKKTTPEDTLIKAWDIAKESLDYVYLGNILAGEKENTFCPSCEALLIERNGYSVSKSKYLSISKTGKGRCDKCENDLNIILEK